MEEYSVVDCEISTSLNEAWFASEGGKRTVLFIVNYCGHMVGMSILITSIKWDNKFFLLLRESLFLMMGRKIQELGMVVSTSSRRRGLLVPRKNYRCEGISFY